MATGTGNLPNQSMSFSPFAILTADEMNNLVENIESLADGTGIGDGSVDTIAVADNAITDAKMDYPRFWQEIGRTKLGTAGDTITVSGLPARENLKVILRCSGTGGIVSIKMTFNGDTSSNYASGFASGGGTDSTQTSVSDIIISGGTTVAKTIYTAEISNIASEEKLLTGSRCQISSTGAGTAPNTFINSGKWANTSDAISSVEISNSSAGSFAIGSELIVLGHD